MFSNAYKIVTYRNKFLINQINKHFKTCTTNVKYLSNLCIKNVPSKRQPPNNWSVKVNVIQQIHRQRPYSHNHNVPAIKVKKDEDVTEQIYVGPLGQRMKVVKMFSLTTSLVGLAVQPVLLERGMELGGAPLAILFCSFAGVFTFLTPFLLHIITKNYVTEMRYNNEKDEYIATTVSILLQKIQTKFHLNDVKVPEVPGMFTSFIARGKPLFVDPSVFHNTDHYMKIMGYDKPIDYKFKEPAAATAAAAAQSSSKDITETKD